MTLGLDLDGVFVDFVMGYADLCEQRSGKKVSRVASHWNWVMDDGVTQHDLKVIWDGIVADPYWWAGLQPLEGAEETLELLNHFSGDHEIYFLTHRPKGAKFYTEAWLRRHGYDHPTVILTPSKGPVAAAIGFDVFIDDKPENVTEVREALPPESRVYMKTASYNLSYEREGVTPIPSVHDLFTLHERLS